jgi:hypothetical protein
MVGGISVKYTPHETSRFAWCALVALRLAAIDLRVRSARDEHLFLMRWLQDAQKEKRFPAIIAPALLKLVRKGKKAGLSAGLKQQLEFFWYSHPDLLPTQSDLFRFTYVCELLKDSGWQVLLLEDTNWDEQAGYNLCAGTGLFIGKENINNAFLSNGVMSSALVFRVIRYADDIQKLCSVFFPGRVELIANNMLQISPAILS